MKPRRARFAEEARLPWLAPLMEAYAVMDAGMAEAVALAARPDPATGLGRAPACAKGCDRCCRDHVIPVTPPEVLGLGWYAAEKLEGPVREAVARAMERPGAGGACPFLYQGACAVYPVRPLACREYVVLGAPCALGEDAAASRLADVVRPPRGALREALRLALQRAQAPDAHEAAGLSRPLLSLDWRPFLPAMRRF